MTTALQADARNRASRSLYQGLLVDVLVAVAVALLAWLPDADITTTEAWGILGVAVAKTVLQAVASYVMRLKLDASPLPTPLPPADPGEPDALEG